MSTDGEEQGVVPVSPKVTESEPDRSGRGEKPAFTVVGIGASAGGLDSFRRFLQALDRNSGSAYVLVQHLSPEHDSLLPDIFGRDSPVPVLEASDGEVIEPDHVYVIPPGKILRLEGRRLALEQPEGRPRAPIDHFFRSLAASAGDKAVAVVLSGTGSDGSRGVEQVKSRGGVVIAESVEEAEYAGMPRSAVATGCVDLVLPPEEIPDAIARIADGTDPDARTPKNFSRDEPRAFARLLELLRAHAGHDFSHYKTGTLNRRLHRRMAVVGADDLESYLVYAEERAGEIGLLYKLLLVGVTRFFRDPDAWAELAEKVIRPLVEAKGSQQTIRVWVPGCSTGEEAYALSILLREEIERRRKDVQIQIFATDIDSEAIAAARLGRFSDEIAEHVDAQRLERFFEPDGDGFRVARAIREPIVFSVDDLISVPSFMNLDLISCRNLLIYLSLETQAKVVEMFHFALRPGGFLFLGRAESVGEANGLFAPVSRQERIYRKQQGGAVSLPRLHRREGAAPARDEDGDSLSSQEWQPIVELARQTLMDFFAPASVLVDSEQRIVYQHGPLREYLQFPTGPPTQNLAALVLEGLGPALSITVQKALQQRAPQVHVAPEVRRDKGRVSVRVRAQPVFAGSGKVPLVLVSFEDLATGSELALAPDTPEDATLALREMESELRSTREELETTIEELETSREELQSLNEELLTVNRQLEEKVGELEGTNDDLKNLLENTEISALFLDTVGKIRRFTPAARRVLRVRDTDVGRPIGDLALAVEDRELLDDVDLVLAGLPVAEKEVHQGEDRWFIRRVLPYRTAGKMARGVVVTFNDVSRLKRTNVSLERRERQQMIVSRLGRLALGGAKRQELFDSAALWLSEVLRCELIEILELDADAGHLTLVAGRGWNEGRIGRSTVPASDNSQAGFTLRSLEPVLSRDLAAETRFTPPKLLTEHEVRSGLTVLIGSAEEPWGVLGAHSIEVDHFVEDEIDFLQAIANVLAEAIGRADAEERLAARVRELRLLHQITAIAAGADSMEEALTSTLDSFCRMTKLSVGHAYVRSGVAGGRLVPADIWCAPEGFPKRQLQQTLERGGEELDEQWADGEPRWVQDLAQQGDSMAAALADIGLRGSFGFPIQVEGQTVAVLRFFSRRRLERDENLEHVARTLGQQVGRVIERQAAATAIREQAQRLSMALSAGRMGAWEWDLESDEVAWSEEHYSLLGYRSGEVEPTYELWRESLHPDDVERVEREIQRARETRTEYRCEYRMLQKDGSLRWVEARGRHSFDGDLATRMNGVLIDITKRKLAEEQAQRARQWSERVAAASPDVITVYNVLEDRTTYTNRSVLDMLGYSSEELEEMGSGMMKRFVHPDEITRFEALLAELNASDSSEPRELLHRIRHRDGSYRWVQQRVVPFSRLADGTLREALFVSRDVTELQEAQRALRDSDRRKDEFLALLGHELRNPLAAIDSGVRLLARGEQQGEAGWAVSMMRAHVEVLRQLVDDLLDLTRISRGKVSLDPKPVHAEDVVSHAQASVVEAVREKEHRLEVRIEPESIPIFADPVRLEQILVNLLLNAVHYTDPGGLIELTVRAEGLNLVLAVRDTGRGLERDELHRIFQPFTQGPESQAGLGLGLALVRELTQLHGGTVEARSEGRGRGSCFIVSMPVIREAAAEVAPQVEVATPPAGGKVLVVDDNEGAAEGLSLLLEKDGFEVQTAFSGERALEVLAEGFRPAVALLDLSLPGMSGYDLARAIRRELGDETPRLVAVTGFGDDTAGRKVIEAGFDQRVVKPVQYPELLQMLAEWMTEVGSEAGE